MAKQLLGKEVTAALNQRLQEQAARLKQQGVCPKLAIVRCGANSSDLAYEKCIRHVINDGYELADHRGYDQSKDGLYCRGLLKQ